MPTTVLSAVTGHLMVTRMVEVNVPSSGIWTQCLSVTVIDAGFVSMGMWVRAS